MRPTRTATQRISRPRVPNCHFLTCSGRQQVRSMHESGQDDYAACPDDEWLSPDPLDHLFKVAYVRGPDVQQSVGFAGDGAGIDDLRVLSYRRPDVARGRPAPAEQL